MVGGLSALGSSGSIITPPAGITGVSVQLMAEIENYLLDIISNQVHIIVII